MEKHPGCQLVKEIERLHTKLFNKKRDNLKFKLQKYMFKLGLVKAARRNEREVSQSNDLMNFNEVLSYKYQFLK